MAKRMILWNAFSVNKTNAFKDCVPWCNCEPLCASPYNPVHRRKNEFQGNLKDEAASLKICSKLLPPETAEEYKL